MYHNPVLLKESIIGLNINPNGIYVDATFGGGGHSTEILNKLNSSGRLIAFDQDQDAIDNKILDKRVSLVKSNFKYLNNYLNYFQINKIDGLKINFDDGWVHLRRSNTEPIIRIYSESVTLDKANQLAEDFISQIKELL